MALSWGPWAPGAPDPLPTDPTVQVAGSLDRARDAQAYLFTVSQDGLLTADVHAEGMDTQLSLLDRDRNPIIQSQAASPSNRDDRISQHLPAGTYYLDVRTTDGGAGNYTLSTRFIATTSSLTSLPAGSGPVAIESRDLDGDGYPDLAVADNYGNAVLVYLNAGDGSFRPAASLPVGFGPGAIASADLNRDGIPDLVTANQFSDDLSVLLGRGDGTFQDAREVPAGSFPTAIAAADFNGDGIPDLAVANMADDDASIFLGTGDGGFRPGPTLATGRAPDALAAVDFDRDGRMDLVVANHDGGYLSIFLGRGDGTFAPGRSWAAPGAISSLAAGDFNRDGIPDLAAACDGSDGVAVLLGRGDGTFRASDRQSTGSIPYDVVPADLDRDGILDLCTANCGDGTVSVFRGRGDGTFVAMGNLRVGNGAQGLAAADLSGDGRVDLATADLISRTATVLAGNGDGTFQAGGHPPRPVNPSAVVRADFNGDGVPDLALADGSRDAVEVMLGRGDGSFRAPISVDCGRGPFDLAAGDLDGDGIPDLAVATYLSNQVAILRGRGDGTFSPIGRMAAGDWPCYLAIADLDGDGRPDVIAANWASNDLSVFLGRGDGTFRDQVVYATGATPDGVLVADVNGDGRPDVVTPNTGSDDVSVLLGRGDGSLAGQVRWAAGPGPWSVAAGDFNEDGRVDLAVSDYTSAAPSRVSVLLGRGDGGFLPPSAVPAGSSPYPIAVGDFNRDGHQDLLVGNDGSNDLSLLLGRGDGTFRPGARLAAGDGPDAMATGDFNGDGLLDAVVANYRSGDVAFLAGNGDGTFRSPTVQGVGPERMLMASADFNGDGLLDVAVLDSGAGTVTIRLNQGEGVFRDLPATPAGDEPSAILVADLNRDGRPDLVVADAGSGNLSILLGLGDGTFASERRVAVGPRPTSLVTGDFDGAGRVEIAVAHAGTDRITLLGSNGDGTFFPWRELVVGAEPVALVAADLNGDGVLDLATANRSSADLSVLLGDGRGGFVQTRIGLPGAGPTGLVAFGQGPGRPPLLVVQDDPGRRAWTVQLAFQGGGVVGDPHWYPTPGEPGAYAQADFNGDGLPDLIGGTRGSSLLQRYIARPDGQTVTEEPFDAGQSVDGLLAGDFNNDGILDLAVGSLADGTVRVWLGVGDAQFVAPVSASPTQGRKLWLGDLNGDGAVDALELDGTGHAAMRLGRAGSPGQFGAPQPITPIYPGAVRDFTVLASSRGVRTAILPVQGPGLVVVTWNMDGTSSYDLVPLDPALMASRVIAGDLDGDGREDLVVLARATGQALVLFQGADGHFTRVQWTIDVGASPSDAVIVRAPGAAFPEIVVADEGSGDVTVVRCLALRAFAPPVRLSAGLSPAGLSWDGGRYQRSSPDQPTTLVAGDFNGDGIPGLVVLDRGSNRICILPGLDGGRFADPTLEQSYQAGFDPIKLVAGAFDADGDSDLAILNRGSRDLLILLNDGSGRFVTGQRIPVGNRPNDVVSRDINGDGKPDLLVSNDSGDLLILLGRGDGTFAPYQRADQVVKLAVGDIDGNGRPTFVLTNEARDELVVTTPQAGQTFLQGRGEGLLAPSDVKIADLNGDGLSDLLVANSGGNELLIYLGIGGGAFASPLRVFAGTNPVEIQVGGVDAHGRRDLFVTNSGSNDVSVFITYVDEAGFQVEQGPRLAAGLSPVSTTVAEVEGDDRPDLLVVNQGGDAVSLLLGEGGGFFTDKAARVYPSGEGPIRAYVGQFVGGPGNDLVIVNSVSSTLTVYSDFLSPGAEPITVPTGGLDPIAAVAGDYNGDGFLDLVVANNGDSRISLLNGGASGIALADSFVLGASGRPTGVVVGGKGGDFRFYVSTEGSNSVLDVTYLLELHAPAPSQSAWAAVQAPGGERPVASIESAPAVWSIGSGANPASPSTSQSLAAIILAGTPGPSWAAGSFLAGLIGTLQVLPPMAGNSLASTVTGLLAVNWEETSSVLPLQDQSMPAVAVLLSSAAEPEAPAVAEPGRHVGPAAEPPAGGAGAESGADRVGEGPSPETILNRYVSGVDDSLDRAGRRLNEEALTAPDVVGPERGEQPAPAPAGDESGWLPPGCPTLPMPARLLPAEPSDDPGEAGRLSDAGRREPRPATPLLGAAAAVLAGIGAFRVRAPAAWARRTNRRGRRPVA
ncbi:FG-GAP repeat protein [Aquisphaera giovannonii]|uniref:FG-GAP repeat protein n=1 Tax=Aquisphaera giovannonii TaxID=406548 RepID=A0A5B9W1T0_9BACT|nr:VCBS repeat-containing protein [Aquisphaera giovannonii]QEH34556.1 FG-GAP repeat protein [Aquisphaera giovannonii]